MSGITVTGLNIYPVKGCQGIELASALLDEDGLRGDREFMVVNPTDGSFMSQRHEPELATVVPDLSTNQLVLTASGVGSLTLPTFAEHVGATMSVSVHEDVAVGQLTNDEADDFFSTVVGKPARLVRTSPTDPRYVSEAFRRQGYVNRQPFADGYPILLTNEASLRSLHYRNGLMHGSVPMARFRPNISVDGIGTTFHEDTWQEITIGDDPTRGVALAIVSPCKRCRVPNIEQSGERAGQKSEINVLKDFLSSRQGTDSTDPNRRKGRFFGQNALISYGAVGKIISIGDAVQIVATGEPNADISSSDVSQ